MLQQVQRNRIGIPWRGHAHKTMQQLCYERKTGNRQPTVLVAIMVAAILLQLSAQGAFCVTNRVQCVLT